jgi:hypothetical protein
MACISEELVGVPTRLNLETLPEGGIANEPSTPPCRAREVLVSSLPEVARTIALPEGLHWRRLDLWLRRGGRLRGRCG